MHSGHVVLIYTTHFSEMPIYMLKKCLEGKILKNVKISPLFEVHSKYIEPAVGFKSHTGSLVMVTDIQISLVDGTHQKLVHALGF